MKNVKITKAIERTVCSVLGLGVGLAFGVHVAKKRANAKSFTILNELDEYGVNAGMVMDYRNDYSYSYKPIAKEIFKGDLLTDFENEDAKIEMVKIFYNESE